MNLEVIREFCLSLPGVTEKVQWGNNLLFNVGGKMFLIYSMSPGTIDRMSLKCTPEKFSEMTEAENIIPAPYLARNSWICIQDGCRIRLREIKELISGSYELVYSKLTKKIKKEIENK